MVHTVFGVSSAKVYENLADFQGERSLLAAAALQQYMSGLYNIIESDHGGSVARDTYELFKPPVLGSLVLLEMLDEYRDDARNKSLTLVLRETIPGKSLVIPESSQVQRIVLQVLSVVLEYMMTEFKDGAYSIMATGGKLM